MSEQYDDTNKGVMFTPYSDQLLVLQGKVNIEGNELRIIGIRQPLKKGGDPVLVVYQQAGILYPNDKKGNEKAPDYSGTIDNRATLRWAGWKGSKPNVGAYLQIKVEEKQNMDSEPAKATSHMDDPMTDDEIPW